jgi:hypothetical protein
MDIDWSVSSWTLAVAGAALVVALIGALVGLRLLWSTLRQTKSITTDLQRRAKFALSCEMTMPHGAAKTREERDDATGVLFTFHDPGIDPIEVRLVVQLKNTGERAANHVLWSILGPSGINLQFTDVSKRVETVDREYGTVTTWTGKQVKASSAARIWDLVARSHTYELAIRFACHRDVLEEGVPIRITIDSDDLYHGRKVPEQGAATWLWVLLSAAESGDQS